MQLRRNGIKAPRRAVPSSGGLMLRSQFVTRFGLQCLLSTSAAVLALAHPVAVSAQSAGSVSQRSFDIPALPLNEALRLFMQQSGIQISYASSDGANIRTSAIKGSFAPAAALSQLLAGTGLTYRFTAPTSAILEPAPSTENGAVQLGPVRVEGAGGSGGLIASGNSDMLASESTRSYTPRGAITSSKLPLTLRETPQSVSVVTRQQIEDRNFITIDEAIESSTGMTAQAANLGSLTFYSRGFSMGSAQIDGVMGAGGGTGGYAPNVAMFDRVEIMRGAAGLVAGQGNPGGVVNLVRKRPLKEARYGFVAHAGSWNQFRAEADISLPVTDWLRVRTIAAYEDRESYIDLVHIKRPLVYGIVEADVTPTTLLSFGASYEENNTDGFVGGGLPWLSDGRDSRLPRSSRGIAPGWNYFEVNATNVFGSVEQQLGGTWKAKVQLNFQHWLQDYVAPNSAVVAPIDVITGIGSRLGNATTNIATITNIVADTETVSGEAQTGGDVTLFGRNHEIVMGASYSRQVSYGRREARVSINATPQVYAQANPWLYPEPSFGPLIPTGYYSRVIQEGVWGVARLNVADPLKIILGARLSNYQSGTKASATAAFVNLKQKGVFTPYGGVTLDLSSNWSTYVSYAEIFRVQNSLYQADGSILPPVRGANYELGAKGEYFDGKLNLSLALFRVVETNRSQIDPENPQPCPASPTAGACYIAEGKVRGQGFETEISGEVVPGLQVTAGYTYTKNIYLRANQGQDFSTITPRHLIRLWANYDLPGSLQGLSIGGGINAQSRTSSNYSGYDIVRQKGYALFNARLGYRLNDHASLAINANNIFDKTYYQRLGAWNSGNRYGDPRSVLLVGRLTY